MPCGDLMRIRLRHALPAAGAAVVAAVAAVVLVPGADAAITASPLVNPVSGKCLSVSGGGSANGTQVVIWTCTGGANRAWTSTAASELRVTIGGVTKCLDASGGGTASGTKLVIWTCTGRASQKWKLNTNGTIVQLWTCKTASNNNQRWTVGGGTLPPSPSRSASPSPSPTGSVLPSPGATCPVKSRPAGKVLQGYWENWDGAANGVHPPLGWVPITDSRIAGHGYNVINAAFPVIRSDDGARDGVRHRRQRHVRLDLGGVPADHQEVRRQRPALVAEHAVLQREHVRLLGRLVLGRYGSRVHRAEQLPERR